MNKKVGKRETLETKKHNNLSVRTFKVVSIKKWIFLFISDTSVYKVSTFAIFHYLLINFPEVFFLK